MNTDLAPDLHQTRTGERLPLRLIHDGEATAPVKRVVAFGVCADGLTTQLTIELQDGALWCCSLAPGLPVIVGLVDV